MDLSKGKVGYADVVGDLMHWGHVQFLEKCKSYCDYLIVGVDNDEIVTSFKRSPIVPFDKRVIMIKSLRCVDEVRDSLSLNPAVMMKKLVSEGYNLKHYFHGDDAVDSRAVEYIEEIGGKAIITPYINGISTSKIINNILDRFCQDSVKDGFNRRN